MNHLFRILCTPLFCASAISAWAGSDMAEDLKSGAIWNMDMEAFGQKYLAGERMTWVDPEKTTLRIPKSSNTIGDMKMGEVIIKFAEKKPSNIQIMVYNKGDDGAYDEDGFNDTVASARQSLNTALGSEGKPYKPTRGETVVKMNVWQWANEAGNASLEAGYSGNRRNFEAEFVRIKLAGKNSADDGGERVTRKDIKANIKREGKRVVIEGIPMVDQGEKGYCAVATAARVFSYYGSDNVDQHELASIADSSADRGTNTQAMKEAIKKVSGRFHMRLREIDELTAIKDFQKIIKAYNRIAKKKNKPVLRDDYQGCSQFFSLADGEILKEVRANSPADIERWMRDIRKWIDQGVPVLWSVQLGVVPEPTRLSQTRGGHMRLIIGYDDEKKVILFSDSWGAIHTCKEMPMADAVAITTGRSILIPSK